MMRNESIGGNLQDGGRRVGEITTSLDRRKGAAWILAVFSLALNANLILLLVGTRSNDIFRDSPYRIENLETNDNNEWMLGNNSTRNTSSTSNTTIGYIRYPKTFGHLHYAKTAGTEINSELAAHFERVCGHKGYSSDFYQFNQRVHQLANDTTIQGTDLVHMGGDIIARLQKTFNRGRVPYDVMEEVGFEDCDYISQEFKWTFWPKVLKKVGPIELHVPCRDSISILMSQCNHHGHPFDCKASDLQKEIDSCVFLTNRFDSMLTRIPDLTLKCFNPIPIDPYLDYMGNFLQRRRIETTPVHRDTNKPRDKSRECIWNNETAKTTVHQLLMKIDYHKFCQDCIGGEHDLLSAVSSY